MRYLVIIVAISGATLSGIAQNPGGVSTNLTGWYKADNTGTITQAAGVVSSWTSSSAGGPALTQGTPTRRPAYISGATTPVSFSYMPRIRNSTATQTHLFNASLSSDIVGTNGAIFYVGDQENTGITAVTYRYNSTAYRYQFKPNFRIQTSDATNGYTFDFGAPTQYSVTSASSLVCLGGGANQRIRINSTANNTCSNCNQGLYNPAVNVGFYLGANPPGEFTNNDIAEVITYNTAPSLADINRIESYLSIKYGITRGGNNSGVNYVSSSSAVVWSGAANTGYNADIAGIARDDNSGLNKKQSISVNNNEVAAIGLTTIAADNVSNANTFTSNNSFLLWGNNGQSPQTNFSNPACFSNLPAGVQARIERIWKTQATNFSQNVQVGFLTSLIVGYTPVSNLRLLVDDDGNFSNATVYTGAVVSGSLVVFNNVDLYTSGLRYFTLATINYNASPLPIELISFSAECSRNGIILNWLTATENNSLSFVIKRIDGINNIVQEIATVPAAGMSTTTTAYTLTDANVAGNIEYYYELYERDANGTLTLLGRTFCRCVEYREYYSSIHQVLSGQLVLSITSRDEGAMKIEIYDHAGRRIHTETIVSGNGTETHILKNQPLSPGSYIVSIHYPPGDKTESLRFIVPK
ncbi:MAG: hypothetical protein IM638_05185 [Bacteroidetes bacterium]|nr:hypothetical protein [Bacteroidota bacterium]